MMNDNTTPPLDQPAYWDNRYITQNTGWDMHQVSPPLKTYIDGLTNLEIAILIPGCGNAYEAAYLLQKGFTNVTLIDFSKVVTDRLREQYKDQPIRIVTEDFFTHEGEYDLILEQTFFCAVDNAHKIPYVKKCHQLLNKGGKIAGVLFNKKIVGEEPPYITSDEETKAYFSPYFLINKYEACTNSIAPRLGTEAYFEFEKKEII
ncbi:MAG: methyltransferase domain-containing protein [Ginsengibacter sp.]|jgi:SAM-dependent methyltransferase